MDSDSVLSVLNTFRNHPGIKNIKSKKFNLTFSFENTYKEVVMKVIKNLNVAKTCQANDIPKKIIKMNKYILLNSLRITSITVLPIAYAYVISVHKLNEQCNQTNYRPVSILINISKIYEKLFYNQLPICFDSLLATNQCGFRKGFN